MRTILMYTSPARGHLYPMMDVAMGLRREGHRVVVQTLSAEADTVEAEGLEHLAISPQIEALELDDYRSGNPIAALKRTFECWLARAPFEVEDLTRAADELEPDLLLVDANTWGAAAWAEGAGRPWAMFLPYCLPVPSRDAPAFGPGLPPPRGWPGRLRDQAIWGLLRVANRSLIRRLNALRTEVGAPPVGGFPDLFQRADLLLYRTAEPFDYPRSDWPECVHPIGPGLWAPPGQVPEWLETFPRPRILVSVSTELQEDGRIIDTALEALADQPGSVVVTTASLDPSEFHAPHDRVRITRFLPHAAVVPEMDLVITHGGMGTTQRALAAGVPVVVVPWGRDQMETARRVEACEAGTFVPPSRLTPDRLRQAVEIARGRRAGAAVVAQAFQSAGGAEAAVARLRPWLKAAGPRSPRREGPGALT